MQILAIANQKGGVGKTTSTVSLAGLLAGQGARVLAIDLDPHGSLSSYLGVNPESVEGGVYALFQAANQGRESSVDDCIQHTRFSHLDLMPATPALATLDRQLGNSAGMGMVVARALQNLEGRYDSVLIDCPPMLGLLMINALAACHRLVIPTQTEHLAIQGLERMLHTIGMVGKSLRKQIAYLIVPTLFDRRTKASLHSVQEMRSRYSREIWGAVIPIDTRLRDASQLGMPISMLDPASRGSQAYAALLKALVKPEPTNRQMLDLASF